jgi:hypothetical protein
VPSDCWDGRRRAQVSEGRSAVGKGAGAEDSVIRFDG